MPAPRVRPARRPEAPGRLRRHRVNGSRTSRQSSLRGEAVLRGAAEGRQAGLPRREVFSNRYFAATSPFLLEGAVGGCRGGVDREAIVGATPAGLKRCRPFFGEGRREGRRTRSVRRYFRVLAPCR